MIAWESGRSLVVALARGRRSEGLDHLADELGANARDGLVLRQRHVGEHGRVSDEARERVAVDVGLPLPAGSVGVAGTDVLGLQSLELLLGAQLVRL